MSDQPFKEKAQDVPLTIIAVLEEITSVSTTLSAATLASLASRNASLIALHIEVDPDRIVTAPEEISLQHMRERYEGTAPKRADEIKHRFDMWQARNPNEAVSWRLRVGTLNDTLPPETHSADLLVLTRPHNMDASDAFHAALFDAKKLVLFAPEKLADPTIGEHIVVAWKPRQQALRAVVAALPWLKAAGRVTVVAADEPTESFELDQLAPLLKQHSIAFEFAPTSVQETEHPADAILRQAAAVGADSVVMGAFRFGMIAEWIFGGVTREMIYKSQLPLFLMH
jgi:nucleotide-binding universal stress UspA family protein